MTEANILPEREFGWKYNLPSLAEQNDTLRNSYQITTPNHNRIYIEVPRTSIKIRGIATLGATVCLLLLLLGLLPILLQSLELGWDFSLQSTLGGIAVVLLLFLSLFPFVRMDIEMPKNEPIRFNRARRKVYFYQYRFNLINMFNSTLWGVKPIVYNWEDLTAEAYSMYAPMGYGGLIERIMIAVREPGSGQIIDRLYFCHGLEEGKERWTAIQLFMEHRNDVLLEFRPPHNSDFHEHYNVMTRFAPKVRWPTEMEIESRTAPNSAEKS